MVRSVVQHDSSDTVLIVESNRNLTWRESKVVFIFLSGGIAGVSLFVASLGAWLVLPFAGLEILVIGGAIYTQSCCAHRRQVIHIDRTRIEIIDPRKNRLLKTYPRAWSKVIQIRDYAGWYPSRLLIGSQGDFIEIGRDLIEDERDTLANHLRSAIEGA